VQRGHKARIQEAGLALACFALRLDSRLFVRDDFDSVFNIMAAKYSLLAEGQGQFRLSPEIGLVLARLRA
jgi:hypothetical protein